MLVKKTEVGKNKNQGNLLGVQPYVTTENYASPQALFTHLKEYLDRAQDLGWISNRTIAVFPEHVGTWLVAAGEGKRILSAKNTNQAMLSLILHHPWAFLNRLVTSKAQNRVVDSIFQLKAAKMAADYQYVFGSLAVHFGITIVAGSIILPNPEVAYNQVIPGTGPLFNSAVVFDPGGLPHNSLTRKIFPVSGEQPFTEGAPIESLPVYETPAGRLGVLVCADSWYPKIYDKLKTLNPDLIAVPSMISETGLWAQPWQGYNGGPTPKDVSAIDIGTLTEGQAWRKYAIAGRLSSIQGACGINVFLHGKIWEMEMDSGAALGISSPEVYESPNTAPAIICVWRTT